MARITIATGDRVALWLQTCRVQDEAKARARGALMGDLAKRMRAGHIPKAVIRSLLEHAAVRDGDALDEVVLACERLISGEAEPPVTSSTTLREFGEEWTSGKLHVRWPDHVKLKTSARDDEERLRLYVYPLIGQFPITEITLTHADLVMSSIPKERAPATRRHVAQALSRLLKLAAYPARIISASPLPEGFLPPLKNRKAKTYLYPDEDRRLLACHEVPLSHRVAYGYLAREGMRKGEASRLSWSDIDLERGAIRLDKNKTGDPRAWALSPGVARALKALHELRGRPAASLPVFGAILDEEDGHVCSRFRAHLRTAEVTRAELYERSALRIPIRIHDLRATFITISLANGKSETWVADRTGHRSSDQINGYRRAARTLQELGQGELLPLDEAIPELRPSSPSPSGGPSAPPDDRGEELTDRDQGEGLEGGGEDRTLDSRGRTRTGTPFRAADFESGALASLRSDHGENQGSRHSDRDGSHESIPIPTDLTHIPASTSVAVDRQALLRFLGLAVGDLAAAGDIAGARVAQRALGELLGATAAPGDTRADVVDLGAERRERER